MERKNTVDLSSPAQKRSRIPILLGLVIGLCVSVASSGHAQDSLPTYEPIQPDNEGDVYPEGAWKSIRSGGIMVALRELELVPKSEPRPALSVRLLPDDYDSIPGNAAFFYMQALAWAEQTNARRIRDDFERKYVEQAREEGLSISEVPPHVWRENTRPEDLPLEEVKEYLSYSAFQQRYLKEAWRRPHCDFDRRIREVESPAMILLPEIQSMRGLARTQSLRFLTAIAEDRVDDAITIFGQQLAFAPHLSQETFLVSNLVGIACASIGIYDASYLCEHPDAPNMYWAIASLPKPLVDLHPALSFERQFLFEEFKQLKEIDTKPKSKEFLRESLTAFTRALEYLGDDDAFSRFGALGTSLAIASGVPGAKRYLIEVEGIDAQTIESLPNTQIFLLGVRRYYEHARDEVFKWQYLTYPQVEKYRIDPSQQIRDDVQEYGLIAAPAEAVLAAVNAASAAQARQQQSLALLQTIEAIRHHLAQNDNQLPTSLDELELPAIDDPATGKPFNYLRHSQGASLYGAPWTGYRVQYELRTTR
ncbi:MAG: hypothetical protein AAGG44_14525 [Planctomycetota bacterium]